MTFNVSFLAFQDDTRYKASKLYSLIIEKEDDAYFMLLDALRFTGNESLADMLERSDSPKTEVETHAYQLDQEGLELASAIEQEFELLQTEVEKEPMPEIVPEHEEGRFHETEVRVQVTAPTESDTEQEAENVAEQLVQEIEEHVQIHDQNNEETQTSKCATPEPNVGVYAEVKQEQEKEESLSMSTPEPEPESEPEPEPILKQDEPDHYYKDSTPEPDFEHHEEPPKPQKQVSFGTTSSPEPKEFIINSNDESNKSRVPEDLTGVKSIVAMNRKMFEQGAPNGDGPKVKYSFAKKGSAGPVPKEEEPKESTVKNLRNFFQKLGSVEAEEGLFY